MLTMLGLAFSLAEAINLGVGAVAGSSVESLKSRLADRSLFRAIRSGFRRQARAMQGLTWWERHALSRVVTRRAFIKKVCGETLTASETTKLQSPSIVDRLPLRDRRDLLEALGQVTLDSAMKTLPVQARMQWRDLRETLARVDEIRTLLGEERPLGTTSDPASRPGIYHLDSKTVSAFTLGPDAVQSQLFFKMSSSLENILSAVCSSLAVPREEIWAAAGNLLSSETRLAFIVGDGGTGKSTLLAELAVHEARRATSHVLLVQLTPRTSRSDIKSALDAILDPASNDNRVSLYIDNPFQNPDLATELILLPYRQPRIKAVLADRANRVASVMADDDLLAEPDYERAVDGCRILRLSLGGKVAPATWAKPGNLDTVEVGTHLRQQILSRMFSAIATIENLETSTLQQVLDEVLPQIETTYAGESISELYLRIAVAYNEAINRLELSSRQTIAFDWDEWSRIFSEAPRGTGSTTVVPLSAAFPLIAALDLFKIPASLHCLQQVTGISQAELLVIMRGQLADGQPAVLENRGQKWYISLRHDTIADLYFSMDGHIAQTYLEQLVPLLDDETALLFERAIFRRKYLRGTVSTPARVDASKLLTQYQQISRFGSLRRSASNTFWLERARIYALGEAEREALRSAWGSFMDKVALEASVLPKSATLSAVMSCIHECADQRFTPPSQLHDTVEAVGFREVCSVLDGVRQNYIGTGKPLRPLDDVLVEIYNQILDRHPTDIPSRQVLAKIHRKHGRLDIAERHLAQLISHAPDSSQAYLNLADVYQAELRSVGMNGHPELRRRLTDQIEGCFRIGLDLSEGADRAIALCIYARYLHHSARRYRASEAAFQEAIECGGNDNSAHNGLGMLYAFAEPGNPLFDPERSETEFREALLDPGHQASPFYPWGILLFIIGRLEDARDRFAAALKHRSKDPNALHYLALIDSEMVAQSEPNSTDVDLKDVAKAIGTLSKHRSRASAEALYGVLSQLVYYQPTEATPALILDVAQSLQKSVSPALKSYQQLRAEQAAYSLVMQNQAFEHVGRLGFQRSCWHIYNKARPPGAGSTNG